MEIAKFDTNRFASNKQEYETPTTLYDSLDREFHFTIDVCANEDNHKHDNYINEETDALKQEWQGTCWMNPPYNALKIWVKKAYQESRKDGCVVVCLMPARTNTAWWHEYCMKGEIRFLKGRPKFKGCIHGLPQPLAIVIFGKDVYGNYASHHTI